MATTLTEWRPFADFSELRNRLDEVFREIGDGGRGAWTPSIDLVREKDRYVLRADVPGIKPDEIKIEVEDGVLTISGEHTEETEEKAKDKDYVRRERRYGSFSRSMTLPKGVEPDDIEATSKDGVLEVVIPAPKQEQKRAVTITPKTD
jgi:HSP20 family protein